MMILPTLSAEGVIINKTLELGLDAVFIEIKNTLDQVRSIFPGFEPANFGEFCLVDGNQATVAAIKSTWLRRSYQVRTQIVHHKVPIYHPDQEKTPAGM